jgi:uncharacterized protein with von Willebrand factor type A (vWA) domain
MSFSQALQQALPHETYLARWVAHREALEPFSQEFSQRWSPRVVAAYQSWLGTQKSGTLILDRQESFLMEKWKQGEGEFQTEVARYLAEIYPVAVERWAFLVQPEHRRALLSLWEQLRVMRLGLERDRGLATQLPEFHAKLLTRLKRAQQGEEAVRSLLTQRDFGWDLESGIADEQDWQGLEQAASQLEKNPELRRIAEIIGRDWRNSRQPPLPPPEHRQQPDPEPGKSEIRGVTWGRSWADTLPQELGLLGDKTMATLFFLKEAEARLLIWDYFTPAAPQSVRTTVSAQRQVRNDRGPLVIVLDTSGSMRGKPELVAKACVLALVRVAWEEERSCYLVSFSTGIRTLDITDLKNNLGPFLDFLKFSFHGGTDLTPALREALRVLATNNYRDADVLVLSDFATPKIPAPLRRLIRGQQENSGTRFYSLTVSTRPLNDFLNIFDAGWIYEIHPDRPEGVNPETLRFSVD